MKTCSTCKEVKPLDDFNKSKGSPDGKCYVCRDCNRTKAAEWYKNNAARSVESGRAYRERNKERVAETARKGHVKRAYGMEWDDYLLFIEDGCAVCGSKENLHIDHNHNCCSGYKSCGDCIRGVLCGKHNRADGAFLSIEEIERYLQYRKDCEQT